jgi:hypothetical protein
VQGWDESQSFLNVKEIVVVRQNANPLPLKKLDAHDAWASRQDAGASIQPGCMAGQLAELTTRQR